MPRKSSLSLPLQSRSKHGSEPSQSLSPRTPSSVYSPNTQKFATAGGSASPKVSSPLSPPLTSVSDSVKSPSSAGHNRAPSKAYFSNYKASKSSTRLATPESSIRQVADDQAANAVYQYRLGRGSTPELSMSSTMENPRDLNGTTNPEKQNGRKDSVSAGASNAEGSSHVSSDTQSSKRQQKSRLGFLQRSRSIRNEEPQSTSTSKPAPQPLRVASSESRQQRMELDKTSPKTAPVEQERRFRDALDSQTRNRSADRTVAVESEDEVVPPKDKKEQFSLSQSFKEGTGAKFFSSIMSSSSKAADGLKPGKNWLVKFSRSGSSNERESPNPDTYVIKVICLPLKEQTRQTRICPRLADCKDKTEFWLPSLAWRCIDYLNSRGIEEEGLYRIPGSTRETKYWQFRFDTELDVNLFEEPDLYDVNVVGSLFKAWMRELPEKIFPKEIQKKIQDECGGATSTPQMLKDELSKLPPFNYYLLFATTCHISLLHSYSEKNKMNYKNLTTCIQPSLDVDPFIFQFLICDWRNCWQGCWTEKEYLDAENAWLAQTKGPQFISNSKLTPGTPQDERVVSSRSSSKPSTLNGSATPEGSSKTRPKVRDRSTSHRSQKSQSREDAQDHQPLPSDDNMKTPTQASHRQVSSQSQQQPGQSASQTQQQYGTSSTELRSLPQLQPISPVKLKS